MEATTTLTEAQFSERRSCGLCGSSTLKKVRQIDCFPILECATCTFLQTGRLLDDATLQSYYSAGYGGDRHRQGQEVNARVNLRLLKKAGALTRGGRLLDIGCGYGFLIDAANRSHGMTGVGIELAEAELSYARDVLKLDVRNSLAAVEGERFDLVVLFETIEHIVEPVGFLTMAARHVAPGGRLAICTDNFRSAVVESLGDRFPKWIPHQHVSLFDATTLPLLIERVGGFRIETTTSFTPWELEVQRVMNRITGGKRGGKTFTLEDERKTENSRAYPLFETRRTLNPLWATVTGTRALRGELMFVVARRTD